MTELGDERCQYRLTRTVSMSSFSVLVSACAHAPSAAVRYAESEDASAGYERP